MFTYAHHRHVQLGDCEFQYSILYYDISSFQVKLIVA